MAIYQLVNWRDEGLEGDNDGLVYGIYHYDGDPDFPVDVEWFATPQERARAVLELMKAHSRDATLAPVQSTE